MSTTNGRGREETEEERADRQWSELLQELRVAQTGVQILFGFLLAVVFQPRFAELSEVDRDIYVVTVVLGSATVAALIGPVTYHRLLTGRRLKPETVIWASRMTVVGLVLLFLTMCSTLLLIMRVALHNTFALWLVGGIALWFLACWFVFPVWALARGRSGPRTDEEPAQGPSAGTKDAGAKH
ncbi:hypothetical protein AMK21_22030 [Streptomyces sp. CB00316]|uniref:DUF6328 family protein n=1 Tax=unclassified Streptomyces TaxID=2593676 RepID=UPI0009397D33|nr:MULTISPECIES: DUF6328 family protein [unclassified Streptomyces]MBT2375975.1 hypothetical protein [Streptomyces sp. ISL-111]MBT2428135.1 hypothetical protein [Streptomyces sp. ISL-112]MBT2463070.1 hypothetical protein [Streptomyces sp. ISL-63]OKJ18241.1 hypothetical protein AMK21_22030 [Streptomyces sp. CB00316]